MDNNTNHLQTLCKKNCGFFGNSAFEGYCSKCYKEHVKRQNSGSASGVSAPHINNQQIQQSPQQAQETAAQPAQELIETPAPTSQKVASSPIAIPTNETPILETACASSPSTSCSMDADKQPKKRNRCAVDSCRKKLGLTGFDCRCGGLYCSEHRYSDKHDCQFNYKEHGQELIRKNNPVVVGEKIQKI